MLKAPRDPPGSSPKRSISGSPKGVCVMAFRWTSSRWARHDSRAVFMLLTFLLGVFAPVSAFAAKVQKVVVRGAQVIIRFDSPVKRARSVMLNEPRRIAIDVVGASPGGGAGGRGPMPIDQGADWPRGSVGPMPRVGQPGSSPPCRSSRTLDRPSSISSSAACRR